MNIPTTPPDNAPCAAGQSRQPHTNNDGHPASPSDEHRTADRTRQHRGGNDEHHTSPSDEQRPALSGTQNRTDSTHQHLTCTICPHRCSLAEGHYGLCRVRTVHNGQVVSDAAGRITALALDPIEKKPLARFHPGSMVLSVGSYGCNMRCPFCQNASIAQAGAQETRWHTTTPEQLVAQANSLRVRGNIGLAFTYNEPLINYEFVYETARLAHDQGLLTILVTNGMINPEPLHHLLPFIDAANVDLKAFTQQFYRKAGGNLETVKTTIATMAACPTCHLEVTTLIIPHENDSSEEMDSLAHWLASLDRDIPYHVSRFFPCYRMADAKPTPVRTVYALAERARTYLTHVYTGNC